MGRGQKVTSCWFPRLHRPCTISSMKSLPNWESAIRSRAITGVMFHPGIVEQLEETWSAK